MGLHQQQPTPPTEDTQSLIESEVSKRLIWSIRQIFAYVATLVGLPRPFDHHEFSLDFPSDVRADDLELLANGDTLSEQTTTPSIYTGLRKSLSLHLIAEKMLKTVYLQNRI